MIFILVSLSYFSFLTVLGLHCGSWASPVAVHGFLQLWRAGSVIAVHGLSLRFSSCGSQVSLVAACGLSCPVACGILVLWLGIEPVSPALQGGFLMAGPPGKSQHWSWEVKNVDVSQKCLQLSGTFRWSRLNCFLRFNQDWCLELTVMQILTQW